MGNLVLSPDGLEGGSLLSSVAIGSHLIIIKGTKFRIKPTI